MKESEGNINVLVDRGSVIDSLHKRIDHLAEQHKESSKYENNVVDYNNLPLKNQKKKQAQQATINIQVKPKIEGFYLRNNNDIFYLLDTALFIALVILIFRIIRR